MTPSRIAENLDVFGFTLADDEIAAIEALNADSRVGPRPGPLQPDLTVRHPSALAATCGMPSGGVGSELGAGLSIAATMMRAQAACADVAEPDGLAAARRERS